MQTGCLPCHQRYTIACFPCHRIAWETDGPPRVRAPHTAMPCCDRVCGCWSVARSVKTEPEQYQWVVVLARHPVASVLARVVQAEPAWVRGQTMLDLGCRSWGGRHRRPRHRPGGARHRRAACAGQCGRACSSRAPRCSMRPAPRVSLVSSSGTSSLSAPRHRPCGPGCTRPTGRGSRSSSRTHPGRVPLRPVCDACGRNAWPPPGPGRACLDGRCGSFPWMSETARRQRPASDLP
jgi:hypothetical protein